MYERTGWFKDFGNIARGAAWSVVKGVGGGWWWRPELHSNQRGACSVIHAVGGYWRVPQLQPKRKKRSCNPTNGFCVVKGCTDRYEGKAKEALHRCAHHRAELKGFKKMVSDKVLLKCMTRAQRLNKPLSTIVARRPRALVSI